MASASAIPAHPFLPIVEDDLQPLVGIGRDHVIHELQELLPAPPLGVLGLDLAGRHLVSLLLAWYASPYWLLLTAFVGLNMLQAAFTGFCPAAMIFRRLVLKTGCAFN